MRNGSSDTLYHAEIGSLRPKEVFKFLKKQCEEELGRPGEISPELSYPEEDDNGRESTTRLILDYQSSATEAELIYNAHFNKANAYKAMQESEDEYVRMIGEALETGEYGGLAI